MKDLILISIFLFITAGSNGQSVFRKHYGGIGSEKGTRIIRALDGGYVFTGEYNNITQGQNALLVKTDSAFNVVWEKSIGTTSNEHIVSIIQDKDSGLIVSGSNWSTSTNFYDFYVLKTDKNGNVVWSKAFGSQSTEASAHIDIAIDGNYILTGSTAHFGNMAVQVIKLDTTGAIIFDKVFGAIDDINSVMVNSTTDDGCIITGYFETAVTDFIVIKLDSLGNPEWQKAYGGPFLDISSYSQVTDDGGFILTGNATDSNSVAGTLIIKCDSIGTVEWSNYFTGVSAPGSIQTTPDGGYIFSGISNSSGTDDLCLVKISQYGLLLWSRGYDSGGFEADSYVIPDDNGYILIGTSNGFPGQGLQVYIVKTDSTGASDCSDLAPTIQDKQFVIHDTVFALTNLTYPTIVLNQNNSYLSSGSMHPICGTVNTGELINNYEINVFPNPAANSFTVYLSKEEESKLMIFDLAGKIIIEKYITGSTLIESENLADGLYYISIINSSTKYNGKIIISRDF